MMFTQNTNIYYIRSNKIHILLIILQIIGNQIMTTLNSKNNILFIQSDSDSEQADTSSNIKMGANSMKLQGNYKGQSNKISKNIFHETVTGLEEYQYEQFSPARKRSRKVDTNISNNKNQAKQISTSSNDNHANSAQQQKSKQQNTQKEDQIFNQPQRKSHENVKDNRKQKLLNFELQNSSQDQSDEQQTKNKIKEDLQRVVDVSGDQSGSQETQKNEKVFSTFSGKMNKTQSKQEQQLGQKITPVDMLQHSDKLSFSTKTVPLNSYIDGQVQLHNQGLSYLYPHFDINFKDYKTHIISCKKQSGAIGANYYLSIQQTNVSKKNQYYLGKIRSSSTNNLYNIFNNKEKKQIVATIQIHISTGPRNIQVYMLKQGYNYFELSGVNNGKDVGLNTLHSIPQNQQCISYFASKKPQWVPQLGKYFLNFGGKVKQASIRNFVLEDVKTQKVVLLFGKEKDNFYNIQIWNPLSPFLALGIIVTQFQKDQ